MKINSIRRITNNRKHNAFTGACWFKGNLYVAYREGDAHVDEYGRLVVLRSRNKGITWDTVAVCRGEGDTRDAHLYTDGEKLFVVGFQYIEKGNCISGCSYSYDGERWTLWKPYSGTGNFVMWRPQWYKSSYYCAGYTSEGAVHWFESKDGLSWEDKKIIYESPEEEPNECALEILPDGTAIMLMRCEKKGNHPYLCRSKYPFTSWDMQQLRDISLTGPAVWSVEGDIYIGGRWHIPDTEIEEGTYHTAIFKVVNGKTYLQSVLPSGPYFDHSYMGVARWPEEHRRFSISFYSNAIAPEDPLIEQWSHPQIYIADVLF